MATLTLEIIKKRKPYRVSFLIRSGESRKRIPTGLTVTREELSYNGKKIREPRKARLIEARRRELQDRMDALLVEKAGQRMDAAYIAGEITGQKEAQP